MSQELFLNLAQTAIHYRDALTHMPAGASVSQGELNAIIDNCCDMAQEFAARLAEEDVRRSMMSIRNAIAQELAAPGK